MSTRQHETLILSTQFTESFERADDWITAHIPHNFQTLIGYIDGLIDNHRTIVFGSDGSKEDWDTDLKGKEWRGELLEFIKSLDYEDGSNPFQWVYFSYGERGHIVIDTNVKDCISNPKPKVVCLCGSTKFKDTFLNVNKALTLQGDIVLMPGCFGHADNWSPSTEQKEALDELHKRKIDMADVVVVLNVNGYIGESTRSEIEYAERSRKEISYYEKL